MIFHSIFEKNGRLLKIIDEKYEKYQITKENVLETGKKIKEKDKNYRGKKR